MVITVDAEEVMLIREFRDLKEEIHKMNTLCWCPLYSDVHSGKSFPHNPHDVLRRVFIDIANGKPRRCVGTRAQGRFTGLVLRAVVDHCFREYI